MRKQRETIAIVCGDMETAVTSTSGPNGDGTDLGSMVLPWMFTLTEVQAELYGAAGSGTFTLDVNANGATVLQSKLTIDASETSSQTAAAAATLKPPTPALTRGLFVDLAKGTRMSVDVDDDAAGDAVGPIVYLIGWRHL